MSYAEYLYTLSINQLQEELSELDHLIERATDRRDLQAVKTYIKQWEVTHAALSAALGE